MVGTIVTATVVAIANSARGAAQAEESVALQQLVRAQIEAVQQSPFKATVADYPAVSNVPAGYTVSFASTNPGTSYTYPNGTPVANVVQQITVTATGDYSQMSMTFYKIRMP